jgi:hypothetical protein
LHFNPKATEEPPSGAEARFLCAIHGTTEFVPFQDQVMKYLPEKN